MWPDLQAFFACALLLACVLHVECIERGLTCTLEDPHRSGVWHTDPISKTGFRCCRNITCQKSEQPKVEPCTNDTFDTRCEPCPVGEYQDKALESQHGYRCKEFACKDDSLRLTNANDRIHRDRAPICECDWEMGNYDRGVGYDYCGVKDCGAGLQMDKSGNCNPCKNGYFKAEANRLQCIGVSDFCSALNMTAPKHHNNTHANCLGGVRGNGGVSISNSSRTTPSSTTVVPSTEQESLTTLSPFRHPQLDYHNGRVTLIVVIVIIVLVLVFLILLLFIIKNWACIRKNVIPKLWRHNKSDMNANAIESGTASLHVVPQVGEENRAELAVEHEDEVTLLNHRQTADKPCGETARLLSAAPALTQPPHANPQPPPRSAAGPSEGSDHDSDESQDSVNRDLPDSDAIKPKNYYRRNISHDSGIDVKSLQLETIVSIDQEAKLQSFPSPRDSPSSSRESLPSPRDSPPQYTSVDPNLAQVHTNSTIKHKV